MNFWIVKAVRKPLGGSRAYASNRIIDYQQVSDFYAHFYAHFFNFPTFTRVFSASNWVESLFIDLSISQ